MSDIIKVQSKSIKTEIKINVKENCPRFRNSKILR